MKNKVKVWAVLADSESSDRYGPFLYHKKPTNEQLEKLAKELDYGDGDGPGAYGSYVYLTVKEVEFED